MSWHAVSSRNLRNSPLMSVKMGALPIRKSENRGAWPGSLDDRSTCTLRRTGELIVQAN
jgi:hypothetical protein